MLIDQYYNDCEGRVTFTRLQGSNFAKQIADDFNPLHDVNTKRFCIPGDLLFSLILARYGCSQQMQFTFSGMVTDEVSLLLPKSSPHLLINGDNGKEYLTIEHSGKNTRNSELINNLTQSYVSFSGQTFPHILVPLMEDKGVMINPARPMAMYQKMLIDLERLDFSTIELEFDKENTHFDVNGKRGNVCLAFKMLSDQQVVGRGEKHMLLSGLMPFEKSAMDIVIADYVQWKKDYKS